MTPQIKELVERRIRMIRLIRDTRGRWRLAVYIGNWRWRYVL